MRLRQASDLREFRHDLSELAFYRLRNLAALPQVVRAPLVLIGTQLAVTIVVGLGFMNRLEIDRVAAILAWKRLGYIGYRELEDVVVMKSVVSAVPWLRIQPSVHRDVGKLEAFGLDLPGGGVVVLGQATPEE